MVQLNFSDMKSRRVFRLLVIISGLDICLLAGRLWLQHAQLEPVGIFAMLIDGIGGPNYAFLVWNLWLAWVPYWLARSLNVWPILGLPFMVHLLILLVWFLFLPNAPYIISDLIHLRPRQGVSIWMDILLFSALRLLQWSLVSYPC